MVASDEIIEEAQVSLRFVNVAGNVVTSLHLCSSCARCVCTNETDVWSEIECFIRRRFRFLLSSDRDSTRIVIR